MELYKAHGSILAPTPSFEELKHKHDLGRLLERGKPSNFVSLLHTLLAFMIRPQRKILLNWPRIWSTWAK
ncbi:hypothetical protein TorRG33x02_349860, partial [Trema orientale]